VVNAVLGLWTGGNVAPLLAAISLTPLSAIVACGFKPYLFLFVIIKYADRLHLRSACATLAVVGVLACYAEVGLTNDQLVWILQHRLFTRDYLYVAAVFLALILARYGEKGRLSTPSLRRKRTIDGNGTVPGSGRRK
jgi:hypothetical protein